MKQTANNFNASLENIYDVLIEKGVITSSRQQTIKGSLNKYAALLGSSVGTCLPKTFVLPPAERNALIDNNLTRTTKSHKGASGLSENAYRNVKNDVSFFLRQAAEYKLLEPDLVKLASYKEARSAAKPFHSGRPNRGEHYPVAKYILDPVPIPFQNELDAYRVWATSPYTPRRPVGNTRRPATHDQVEEALKKFAGYLVKFKGFRAEEITLSCLTVPQNLIDFVAQYVENQGGKYTCTVSGICSKAICLATYLKITAAAIDVKREMEERIIEIKEFKAALPRAVKVMNKKARWIPLKELDAIGKAYDPANFAERDHNKNARADFIKLFKNHEQGIFPTMGVGQSRSFRNTALQATVSLMLRLIVRIPLRQRSLREMEWDPVHPERGRNLYKIDGEWHIRFGGPELKIGQRGGEENQVDYVIPPDLSGDLDRYMKIWRPLVINSTSKRHCAPERPTDMPKIVGQEYFFLNSHGRQLTMDGVNDSISKLTYQYVGVAMNPHTIRSIWVTEYLEENVGDAATAAYMINDTIETVLKTYAKLVTAKRQGAATTWLATHLAK